MNLSTPVIAAGIIVLLGGLMLIWWWTSRPTLSGGLRALLRIVAIPVFVAPTTGPVALYTLEKGEHRNPVPIVWHAESGTFFVGTKQDSSIFRGRPDDPSVRVFLEGQPGQAAAGIGISGRRILVAGAEYGDIRVYDLQTRQRVGEFSTGSGTCLMGMHVMEARRLGG